MKFDKRFSIYITLLRSPSYCTLKLVLLLDNETIKEDLAECTGETPAVLLFLQYDISVNLVISPYPLFVPLITLYGRRLSVVSLLQAGLPDVCLAEVKGKGLKLALSTLIKVIISSECTLILNS